ncbi:phospholipase DDHD1-like [Mantella aurantiaca]
MSEKNGECEWEEEEEAADGEQQQRRRPEMSLELQLSAFSPEPGSPEEDEDEAATLPLPAGRRRTRSSSSRPRYEIVTELGPEEVRWFYKEDKKTWKPFIGYDSLRIELAYRRVLELTGDTEEAAEPLEELDLVTIGEVARSEPVCVRSGLYEVDVTEGECYPVYWNQADKIPVMRGQWFIDGTWQPLDEDESNLIELEHLKCFRGQQMHDNFDLEVAKPVDHKDVVPPPFSLPFLFSWRGYNESTGAPCAKRRRYEATHSLKLSRSHVDWHSVDEVYLYSDATTSKIARTVTQKLGFSKGKPPDLLEIMSRGWLGQSS